MMPWWALAVLIFGANFAIWGFIGLCRQMAVLIRKVHSTRAARPCRHAVPGRAVRPGGNGPALAAAGSAHIAYPRASGEIRSR